MYFVCFTALSYALFLDLKLPENGMNQWTVWVGNLGSISARWRWVKLLRGVLFRNRSSHNKCVTGSDELKNTVSISDSCFFELWKRMLSKGLSWILMDSCEYCYPLHSIQTMQTLSGIHLDTDGSIRIPIFRFNCRWILTVSGASGGLSLSSWTRPWSQVWSSSSMTVSTLMSLCSGAI